MTIRPRKLLLPAAIVLALAALAWWSAARPVLVDLGTVARGDVRETVEEEGRTRVRERFELSAPVDGRLFRVALEPGDPVIAGQVLAEIDPLSLESRVREAEARIAALSAQVTGVDRRRPDPNEIERSKLQERVASDAVVVAERELAEAQAAHEQARREASRARDLEKQKTISAAERETAELAETRAAETLAARQALLSVRGLEVATAELTTKILVESARDLDWEEALYRAQTDQVRAGLEVLRDDLRRAEMVAPVSGVILDRYRESEAVLSAGTPVLAVGSLADLEAEADLLSEDAARMRPGMAAEVFGRALGDRVLPATVKRIEPGAFTKISSLGVEQQRVLVVFSFDASGMPLGDRYRVDVRVIFDGRRDALLVPESALFRAGDGWHAFRVEGGRARATEVRTGLRDGRFREILAGLAAGDEVILYPDAALRDGARVEGR
ncbi:MAG: efflux RND transporter periplasmic adaptor subunit [Planctomycetes bacterium]|jgi:HlyD family secretion protein|nr:efflux RND transporter periplasmic adaptor subunit [Planctomycetota bacterium]